LFLAWQHLNLGSDLRECEDYCWFKVPVVPVFYFDVRCFCIPQVEDHWSKGLVRVVQMVHGAQKVGKCYFTVYYVKVVYIDCYSDNSFTCVDP
jgi:hypothetical protein